MAIPSRPLNAILFSRKGNQRREGNEAGLSEDPTRAEMSWRGGQECDFWKSALVRALHVGSRIPNRWKFPEWGAASAVAPVKISDRRIRAPK